MRNSRRIPNSEFRILNSPLRLCYTGPVVGDPREDEEQIRQPIDVAQQNRIDWRLETHDAALGAAADGAGDVERGSRSGPAGENETAQRRQLRLETIDQLLDAEDVVVV